MIKVRWHGRGGQGSFTAARLLGLAASIYGEKYALAFPSFGPERRGAPVLAFTKIDDGPILDRSEVAECDFVVVLDDTLINENTLVGLKEYGHVIINSNNDKWFAENDKVQVTTVNATEMALEALGKPITNTAMLGALLAKMNVLGLTLDAAEQALENQMAPNLRKRNRELMRKIFEKVRMG